MSFFLYYILRRYFVRLEFADGEIRLEKGIWFKRTTVLPVSAIMQIMVKRTLIMRIFHAKEVKLGTLNGEIKLYLKKGEYPPFLPEFRTAQIKSRFGEILFGAFIDTRALGGIFVFIAILRKISAVFGGDYSDKIVNAISTAAENVTRVLELLHIAVPKIAAALAVFAIASWIVAYLRKVARLSRFGISRRGNILFVKSGLITLYEHTLVLNSNGVFAASCDTITTILAGRAPLYLGNTMISPCVKRKNLTKTLHALCKMTIEKSKISPPKRTFLGFCGAPLGWSGAFAAALAVVYCTKLRAAILLKTALYSGVFVALYTAVICLVYMRYSGVRVGESVCVSGRKGLRLYNSIFAKGNIRMETRSQSLFQRKPGLCNIKISISGKRKFAARQLIKSEIPGCIRF